LFTRLLQALKKERVIYYFIPAAIVLSSLAVYPLLNNLWLSLHTKTGKPSIANYSRLFKDKWFWNSIAVTGKWMLLSVTGELLVGLILSNLINLRLKGTKLFRTILMIPWMTPMIAVCTIWAWMYNGDFGILNYGINQLFGTNILFLSKPQTAIVWLSVVYIWKRSSFNMLMYLSGLQGISDDIYDACKVDGAPWYTQLFKITLPLIFPIIRSVLLISIITAINQFTIPYSITRGGPSRSTELIQMYIYNTGIAGFQYNYGATASTVFIAIVLCLAVVYIFVTDKAEEDIY
jgi:ABC-type sugar transport system permease subunit